MGQQPCSMMSRVSQGNCMILAKHPREQEANNCVQRGLHGDTPQCFPLEHLNPPQHNQQWDKHQRRASHSTSFRRPASQPVPKPSALILLLSLESHNLQQGPPRECSGLSPAFLEKGSERQVQNLHCALLSWLSSRSTHTVMSIQ